MLRAGIFIFTVSIILLFAFTIQRLPQENHPPVVKIISPKPNSNYQWNSTARYMISVTDKEDGDSKFQEIPVNEVLLEARYVKDTSVASAASLNNDRSALQSMLTSNCMNCHAFNSILIGPSFYEISKRYPSTKLNEDVLVKHIIDGSTGIWGSMIMPTHKELPEEETHKIVKWILKNGARNDVSYYIGTEGSFRLAAPDTLCKKGGIVLTATYTDHGLKDKPDQKLSGQDVVIIQASK